LKAPGFRTPARGHLTSAVVRKPGRPGTGLTRKEEQHVGLFKQYLDLKYPAMAWQTKDPDDLLNGLYSFMDEAANEPAVTEFGNANKAIYDLYMKDVKSEVSKANGKFKGLANAPVGQQPIQKANHLRLLVNYIDDKADKIVLQGRLLLVAKAKAEKEAEEQKILDGTWVPDLDNTIPAPASVNCNSYKGKHFGADNKAAQYLGRFKDNPKLVKALEQKAKSALFLEACIFRFDEIVGHDGTKGPNSPTSKCIRVDSLDTGGEHSYPIPESGVGSHDAYVKDSIIKRHNTNNKDGLLDIARYLTIIGAAKGEYAFSNAEKAKLTGKKFNLYCCFWNPKP
jgi:hypothetical protein